MNIFLDDFRYPQDAFSIWKNSIYLKLDWVILRNHDEFVNYINSIDISTINIISWDHDLADEHYSEDMYKGVEVYNKNYELFKEKTGYHTLKWFVNELINKKAPIPVCYFHSQNPVGRFNMESYWESFKKSLKTF